DLQAGHAYPMSLWTREGTNHVHFAVFPGDPAFVGGLDQAFLRSQPVAGQDYEVASFTPLASARYLIVAWRDASEAPTTRYQFAIGSQAVGVGIGQPWGVSLTASPNPSHAPLHIRYALPEPGPVRLELLDVQGRIVRTVLAETQGAGAHEVS